MDRARDMDLIRKLMLDIEAGKTSFEHDTMTAEVAEHSGLEAGENPPSEEEVERIEMHLAMLSSAGLVVFEREYGGWFVREITWKGYDFIETLRDPSIWKATKGAVKKVGCFTLDTVMSLGAGYLKQKAVEMGLPMG